MEEKNKKPVTMEALIEVREQVPTKPEVEGILWKLIRANGGKCALYDVGHGLEAVDGKLAVSAVDNFSGDNTLPMTAAGVQTIVGNIEALLETI